MGQCVAGTVPGSPWLLFSDESKQPHFTKWNRDLTQSHRARNGRVWTRTQFFQRLLGLLFTKSHRWSLKRKQSDRKSRRKRLWNLGAQTDHLTVEWFYYSYCCFMYDYFRSDKTACRIESLCSLLNRSDSIKRKVSLGASVSFTPFHAC